jgi:hypothetical protein
MLATKAITYPNTNTLAKQKLPIFGALRDQKSADDDQDACHQERNPKVTDVEHTPYDKTWKETQRILN